MLVKDAPNVFCRWHLLSLTAPEAGHSPPSGWHGARSEPAPVCASAHWPAARAGRSGAPCPLTPGRGGGGAPWRTSAPAGGCHPPSPWQRCTHSSEGMGETREEDNTHDLLLFTEE